MGGILYWGAIVTLIVSILGAAIYIQMFIKTLLEIRKMKGERT